MRAAAGLAAVAALALVAAAAPTQPVGTARTRLTAAELSLSGVTVPVDRLTLLDVSTFASTDADTSRNPAGVPFSSITVAPAKLGDSNVVPPVTVSSDGASSVTTATFDQDFGIVGAKVNPLTLNATAAADRAESVVSAATAQLDVLNDALGLSLNQVPAVSKVDATGASASAGIDVDAVDLDLQDLLPVDLADLPLGTILELADVLANQLSIAGLDTAALSDALDDVQAAITNLSRLASEYAGASDAVLDADAALDAANAALDAAEAELAELQADLASLDPTTLASLLAEYGDQCPLAVDVATLTSCLNGLIDAAEVEVADAQADVDSATAGLDAAVDELLGVLDELGVAAGALDGTLDSLLTTLQAVLAQLQAILDQLPDASLLHLDPLAVQVSATATADGGTGTVQCGGGGVSIAGTQVVADIDGCTTFSGAAVQVTAALAQVEGVLQALTGVDVPTPHLALFAQRTVSDGTDGAYRTASASVNVLELRLPSVALDDLASGAIQGMLEDISSATVSQLLAALDGALGTDSTALAGVAAELDAALAETRSTVSTALGDAGTDEDALNDLLAQVEDLVGGIVPEGLATPGVDLVVDPTATAQFAPVETAGGNPTPPAAPAAPTQPTQPSLPATGGGLALLGALAAAGGLALRRRH